MTVEIIEMYRLYSSLRYGDSLHNSLCYHSRRGSVIKGIIVECTLGCSCLVISPLRLPLSPRITCSLISALYVVCDEIPALQDRQCARQQCNNSAVE